MWGRYDPLPTVRCAVRELVLQQPLQSHQRGRRRIGTGCCHTYDLRGSSSCLRLVDRIHPGYRIGREAVVVSTALRIEPQHPPLGPAKGPQMAQLDRERLDLLAGLSQLVQNVLADDAE
jgi:hypothetical protein